MVQSNDALNLLIPNSSKCALSHGQNPLRCYTEGETIAIDGKTMRGSVDKAMERSAIHMVSAWASENKLVLGQIKTNEKSNEITAIPEFPTV